MAKITYLEHSGFAVTLDDVILVFDDTRDPSHALHHILDKNPDKQVVFFISHRDPGHYNHAIFEMAQNHKRTYVVSNEVPAQDIPSTLNVAGMSAGDVIEGLPGNLRVKAYGAKAGGLAFLVTLPDGSTIYHAGCPKDDERAITRHLAEDTTHINVAFFPIDPGRGGSYTADAVDFLRTIKVDEFYAMHFGGDWKEVAQFTVNERMDDITTNYHCIHTPGGSDDVKL